MTESKEMTKAEIKAKKDAAKKEAIKVGATTVQSNEPAKVKALVQRLTGKLGAGSFAKTEQSLLLSLYIDSPTQQFTFSGDISELITNYDNKPAYAAFLHTNEGVKVKINESHLPKVESLKKDTTKINVVLRFNESIAPKEGTDNYADNLNAFNNMQRFVITLPNGKKGFILFDSVSFSQAPTN